MDNSNVEREESCREILVYIFSDYEKVIARIAPHGWDKSPFYEYIFTLVKGKELFLEVYISPFVYGGLASP